jgi:hypothetical protein
MKVTAILPDDLIREVKHYAKGKNLTESIVIALKEWLDLKYIKELNKEIESDPLEFSEGFSAQKTRDLNRQP